MGFAEKLGKGLQKLSPARALHQGINKKLGIEPDFMAPGNNPMQQRIDANRSGDSQWQKINPTNIRDANAKVGYDYAGGGRDEVPKPTPNATPNVPGGAPSGGLRGMLQRAKVGQGGTPMNDIQKQFGQANALRGPQRGMRIGRR
jgi:hypothetical protein